MAAGLGFKDFTTGEVLTAADVDGYLMQGVWVFASATARDAAVTSPQEGNFAYLKDTNVTTYYTGSAWANLDTTGMTNPMTTTGDTIYSSSGSTPARLGIGSTGQVLTVAGGVPSWATAGGGSLTKITSASFSAQAAVNVDDCFTSTYKNYLLVLNMFGDNGALGYLQYRYAGPTTETGTYYGAGFSQARDNAVANYGFDNVAQATIFPAHLNTAQESFAQINITGVGNASERVSHYGTGVTGDGMKAILFSCRQNTARTYTGFRLTANSGNIDGTYAVYGYAN
jgi:hypothetical protein